MIEQLQKQRQTLASVSSSDPILLCAADDNYVKPLAVTLHSAAKNLRVGIQLSAIVFDGGIKDENKEKPKESLCDMPIDLYFVKPDCSLVKDLNVSHHITHTAYLRLLAGQILPDNIEKVIYLDSDLLVQGDLTELWELDLDGNFALAVPDIACPYIDARHADCNYAKSSPYLSGISPISNWKSLGLNPASLYFNSGVMVLNIERMRKEQIEQKLIACLNKNRNFVWCWDQYALNVVFAENWKPLPLRWNQGAKFFELPSDEHGPFHPEEIADAIQNPAIIHFTTEWKPWDFKSEHPLKEKFFHELDQTVWSGWRPQKPDFDPVYSWNQFAGKVVVSSVILYRKIANQIFRPRYSAPAKLLPKLKQQSQRVDTKTQVSTSDHKRTPQITLFAIPRPFEGRVSIRQQNAISSWKLLAPFVEVILLGDDSSITDAAKKLGVRHVPGLKSNSLGTPLVSSAFSLVNNAANTPYLCYCNCDILLFEDFVTAVDRIIHSRKIDSFLSIGRRTTVAIENTVNFDDSKDVQQILELAKSGGQQDSFLCKDYFVFPKSVFQDVPDFAVGRGNWDNWLVYHAKKQQIPVINLSQCVTAIHQKHDYAHSKSRLSSYVTGKEANQNKNLAGGFHWLSGSTSDYYLTDNQLIATPKKRVFAELWQDIPALTRLVTDLLSRK
ncbi:MAG: glycosyltransferase family 8 protein [Planctomycetota bacterium]